MKCPTCGGATARSAIQFVDGAPFYEDVCWNCRIIIVGERAAVHAHTVAEVRAASEGADERQARARAATAKRKELEQEIMKLEEKLLALRSGKQPKPVIRKVSPEDAERLANRKAVADAMYTLGSKDGMTPEALAKALLGGAKTQNPLKVDSWDVQERRAREKTAVEEKKVVAAYVTENMRLSNLRRIATLQFDIT